MTKMERSILLLHLSHHSDIDEQGRENRVRTEIGETMCQGEEKEHGKGKEDNHFVMR